MQYLLMIYEEEALREGRSQADFADIMKKYRAFNEDIKKSGNFVSGEPLQSVRTATTVRVRDGNVLTTDGPFAETKEQLGGFYLIDAADLDQALAIAAKIPAAQTGSIEVRPLMVFDNEHVSTVS